MGGERETVLSASEKSEVFGSVGTASGRLRIHEKSGEVHFHDDEKKLKCTVPVAEWWKAWERLRTQGGDWKWIDTVNNTALFVNVGPDANMVFDASVNLYPLTVGPNFSELQKFTKKR